ncbi:MAG: GatB/YqeY domain-containing protein [Candidatus Brocadiae bacterium]|nr:GatB/YqeY domain-containing protein [Candidatus Brocadiia bacterium]
MGKIREKLAEDIKIALKEQNAVKISTLRMIKAELMKIEVDQKDMDEAGFLQLVRSMKKQREESISEFKKANREDLIEIERKEMEILDLYLPAQLSSNELERLVDEAIAETGAKNVKSLGLVMKAVMAKAGGRADGKMVNAMAKEKLEKLAGN